MCIYMYVVCVCLCVWKLGMVAHAFNTSTREVEPEFRARLVYRMGSRAARVI